MSNVAINQDFYHSPFWLRTDPSVILLVADDIHILSSLRRLLRPKGYHVLTARSAADGLALLKRYQIDLIMSDMRMPQMNGAQLLLKVGELCPDTARILLSAYSEINTFIDDLHGSGGCHYLQKPWDEQDLFITLACVLAQRRLKKQAEKQVAQVHQKNRALIRHNLDLATQVNARTEEIRQTALFLERSRQELKETFVTTLKVFSNLVELRNGMLGGQSAQVAELMRRMGQRFSLSDVACTELWSAGLLHAVGKIGLPDELIRKPQEKMNGDELRHFTAHPLSGQMVLMPLASFNGVGKIIRYQYERYDGRGCPESLEGEAIPLGARILAVTRDFEALRAGAISARPLSSERALKVIRSQSEYRYDPQIVDTFLAMVEEDGLLQPENVQVLRSYELLAGMQLADDLRNPNGVLLLTRDSILSNYNIAQIKKLEKMDNIDLQIQVRKEAGRTA